MDGVADEAISDQYPQSLKDQWGVTLFEFTLRGLFEHRFLHADPNFANFAFREDGKVAVYDYGCMKEIPADIAAGYSGLMNAVMRIIAVATTVENQLSEMGGGASFDDGSATTCGQQTCARWTYERRTSGS